MTENEALDIMRLIGCVIAAGMGALAVTFCAWLIIGMFKDMLR